MKTEELEEVTKLLQALKGDVREGTFRLFRPECEARVARMTIREERKGTIDLSAGKPIIVMSKTKKKVPEGFKSVFLNDTVFHNDNDFFMDEANLYFTPNIFTKKGKKEKGNVAYLTTLFADLDDCTVDEAMKRLKESPLPEPSYALFTGHGVHFYWILKYKLPVNKTDKKDYNYDKSWLKVQRYITKVLKSDTRVNEISKYMRIPLSTNHNIKKDKDGKIIEPHPIKSRILIDNLNTKYDFRKDFYNKFCKSAVPFDPNKYKNKKKKKRKNKNTTNVVSNYPPLFNEDIETLLMMRKNSNFKWEGLRTYTLLMFKCNNKTEEYIRYINNEVFENPLSESEVKNILKYENQKIGLTREKAWEWLEISDDELKEMKVLIPENEVKDRKTIKKALNKFDSLAKEYMGYLKFNYIHNSKKKTNRQIGKDLGYDEATISRYKKNTYNIRERNQLAKRTLIEYETFQNLKQGIEESDKVYSKETLKRLQEADNKITKIKDIIEERNELTTKNKFKVTVLLAKYKEIKSIQDE